MRASVGQSADFVDLVDVEPCHSVERFVMKRRAGGADLNDPSSARHRPLHTPVQVAVKEQSARKHPNLGKQLRSVAQSFEVRL